MTSRKGGRGVIGSMSVGEAGPTTRGLSCHGDGGDHRAGMGLILPGDTESGAVIGRRADERQTQRDIDPLVEMQRLDGDQCLVVIAAQHRVISGPRARVEQRIGRERPGRIDPLGTEFVFSDVSAPPYQVTRETVTVAPACPLPVGAKPPAWCYDAATRQLRIWEGGAAPVSWRIR